MIFRRFAVFLPIMALWIMVGSIMTLIGPPAPAGADDTGVVETPVRVASVPEPDGTPVRLDATILTTDPATPRPAIVLAHGFGGTQEDSRETARDLARRGYAVLIYTARGFGGSGGRIHLGNPAYEGKDAEAMIDLAARRPEVLGRNGDPVIGFAGVSYGGAAALLAAGLDPRVDAIVPAFTWYSLTQALFPQYAVRSGQQSPAQVVGITEPGVFKQRWASLFFGGGGATGDTGSPTALCGRFDRELCRAHLATAESGRPTEAMLRLLARSDLGPVVSAITAPTLLIAGEQDTLFPLDQADATWSGLPSSTTAKMVWTAGGHDGEIAMADLMPQLEAWFDRYLAGDGSAPDTAFELAVPQTALVGSGDGFRQPLSYSAAAYPGRGAALVSDLVPLTGGEQTITSPPGGAPAALTSLPGTGNALASASSFGGYALGVLPGQAATFTSAPLAESRLLSGSGRIRLQISSSEPTATLFVSVWDLGPEIETVPSSGPSSGGPARATPGTAVLPQLAVAPVRLSGLRDRRPVEVEVALPPVVHRVPVGHRLQVVVSSTDQAYALPSRAARYTVTLAGPAQLRLPGVNAEWVGADRIEVPLPLLIVVSALLLAAVAATAGLWLRRRAVHPRPDLADLPLVADGLVKTYRNGVRAVDGVSFTAGSGQVVGLLGPNGAGKTTVLRMLVGLIRPDSGQVFVRGDPVHAGAEVLAEVGALIEGPGFLPHLTGMENLRAYWAATGRPLEEAGLDEVLQIAGLGAAIHRRIRGYSQGMRQRLGIAQAMLGRPALLLLDEPTNGLDPPQIKAMRRVLHDYAGGGRTVVVSSHLLGEVQQTCSHVVVMHRGRVILTGAVAELTATDDVTMIGLLPGSDLPAARAVLEGLGATVSLADGLIRIGGPVPRPRLISALVDTGFAIDSVDGHRQLEEVFLSLVGTSPGESG